MKIENTQVFGFEAAIRAMRNPMNSWARSDSKVGEMLPKNDKNYNIEGFILGEADKTLSQKLSKAGTEHCKHLRLIQVWADLTLPRYVWQEFDQYHFVTTLSTSTMHTITKRLLTQEDFEFEFTEPLPTQVFQKYEFYDDDKVEWRVCPVNDNYFISNDGRIKDKNGNIRETYADYRGYVRTSLDGEKYMVHRLVALAFIPNPNNLPEVNHKDGNKLNNKVENLEWVTSSENQKHAISKGLQPYTKSIRQKVSEGNGKLSKEDRQTIFKLKELGLSNRQIARIFGVSHNTIGSLLNHKSYTLSEDITPQDIAEMYLTDTILTINKLINHYNRVKTKEKKDEYFLAIKTLLPECFLQKRTITTNYQCLANIYRQRHNHRLPEWHKICDWILGLPYFIELTGIENNQKE